MTSSGIDLSFLPRSGSGIGGSIAAITSIGIDLSDSASTAAGLGASISATTPNGSDRFIDSAWSGAVRTGGRRPSGGGDTIAWVGMLGPAAGTRGCGRGGKDGGDGFCSSSGGGRSASGGLVFGIGTVLDTSSATGGLPAGFFLAAGGIGGGAEVGAGRGFFGPSARVRRAEDITPEVVTLSPPSTGSAPCTDSNGEPTSSRVGGGGGTSTCPDVDLGGGSPESWCSRCRIS